MYFIEVILLSFVSSRKHIFRTNKLYFMQSFYFEFPLLYPCLWKLWIPKEIEILKFYQKQQMETS